MSLARDLLALYEAMSEEDPDLDPFRREFRPRLEGDPKAQPLLHSSRAKQASADPVDVVQIALQLLRVHEESTRGKADTLEFVATAPDGLWSDVRPTRTVVTEMLSLADRHILAFGYQISDADFLDQVVSVTRRGISVDLICDRESGTGAGILHNWPSGCTRPRVWVDQDRKSEGPYAKMHAKALVVDTSELLVSSANFTFHGLNANLEFGVRLRGEPVAKARRFFEQLVSSGFLTRFGEDGGLTGVDSTRIPD